MVGPTIDSPLEVHSRRPIRWCHCRPSKTYRLATIPHDWHTIVRYDPSRSSRVVVFHVVWKPICNFLLAINSNLGHISHRSAAEARNGLQGHQSSMIFLSNLTGRMPLFSFKHFIQNCGQTAADWHMVTSDSLKEIVVYRLALFRLQ